MWKYHNPVRIHAAPDGIAHLPEMLNGRDCLLVTFPEARSLGLVKRLQALLGPQLRCVIDEVQPNPDVRWLAPLYDRVHSAFSDVPYLVALGGGSVIDTAKALMCATPTNCFDEMLAVLATGGELPTGPHKSLIAVPTTAGTGSEVTPWATLWDATAGRKHSLHQPWTWPEAAIIDPSLMLSLPASTTLASGLDALSHALESIWNVHRNPVSMALASNAARRILNVLPRLMLDPCNAALRTEMADAALMAGLAFSNTKTALAHSLSYEITLRLGVTHGIACSFSLPLVLEMALGVDAQVDRTLLDIFDADTSDIAVHRLRQFLMGLGVATDPQDYGITSEDWNEMVLSASAGPRGLNFIRAIA